MRKVLAIAELTFREAIRKKILLVLLLFAVALIACSPFLPVIDDPEARRKLIESVCLGTTTLFGALIGMFMVADAIPRDLSEKKIYNVISKPITRLQILLGKLTGFLSIIAVTVALTGIMGLVFIQSRITEEGVLRAERFADASKFRAVGDVDGINHRYTIVWFKGAVTNHPVWEFRGIKHEVLPEQGVSFDLVDIWLSGAGRKIPEMSVRVVAENPSSGQQEEQVVLLQRGETSRVVFPHSVVDDSGRVNLSVHRIKADEYIGGWIDSVTAVATAAPYSVNFTKALLMIFFKLAVVVCIALMGSTFLSTPVNVTASFVIYMSGHLIGFMKESARAMLSSGGGASGGHGRGVGEAGSVVAEFVSRAFALFLRRLSLLFPDFRIFDVGKYMLDGRDISGEIVAGSLLYAVLCGGVIFIIGAVIFHCREVD